MTRLARLLIALATLASASCSILDKAGVVTGQTSLILSGTNTSETALYFPSTLSASWTNNLMAPCMLKTMTAFVNGWSALPSLHIDVLVEKGALTIKAETFDVRHVRTLLWSPDYNPIVLSPGDVLRIEIKAESPMGLVLVFLKTDVGGGR